MTRKSDTELIVWLERYKGSQVYGMKVCRNACVILNLGRDVAYHFQTGRSMIQHNPGGLARGTTRCMTQSKRERDASK